MSPLEILLVLVLLLLVGVLLALVFLRLSAAARRRGLGSGSLKPHYQRLGRFAPGEPCPCGAKDASERSYAECCRPRDVAALEEDVRAFLWKYWSHHSYAGRRRSSSMRHRLEDHPLPQVVLPDWVISPEKFTFPIDEQTLRNWSPLGGTRRHKAPPVPEDRGEGLPF
jgi:hypothetical protein